MIYGFFLTFFTSEQFKVRPNLHCGTTKKPLEPYNPTSYRSRLPLPDNKMPSKNASQIEIGDRGYFKEIFLFEKTFLGRNIQDIS